MTSGVGHVRHGFGTVRPYLYGPAGLTAFLRRTFGAVELERHAFDGHSFHVELQIGDSVLAVEEGPLPPGVAPWTGSVYVYVEDVDATFARAVAEGARTLAEPAEKPYGERQAGFVDTGGNSWWIGTFAGAPG